MDKSKLILPISILLGCIILGGFYYASQINKQKSIEKQQQIELKQKAEETKQDYLLKRKTQCYEAEQTERKTYNNVDGSFYDEKSDICKVRYINDKWGKGDPGDCPVSADMGRGLDLDKIGNCTIPHYAYKAF